MARVLYIDYENVQRVDLCLLGQRELRVCLFTGVSQSKIPIDLAKAIQPLGDKLTWVTIDGNGPNALDFHIAYYLAVHTTQNSKDEHFLLSKDKGFDPLISHIRKRNIPCRRISSTAELESTQRALTKPKKTSEADGMYAKVLTNLGKIEPTKRPRNRKTLRQHVRALVGKSFSEQKLDQIIGQLFDSGAIAEVSGRLTYQLTT
jgi:hypothetical protein